MRPIRIDMRKRRLCDLMILVDEDGNSRVLKNRYGTNIADLPKDLFFKGEERIYYFKQMQDEEDW